LVVLGDPWVPMADEYFIQSRLASQAGGTMLSPLLRPASLGNHSLLAPKVIVVR
jgi:hypothetical protein